MSSRWIRRFVRLLTAATVASALVAPLWVGAAAADTGSGTGSASSGSATGSFSGSASGSAQLPVTSPRAVAALAVASTQIGKPYEWGGTGPDAWDCSGLVQWAYRQVGINLPRTTWLQVDSGLEVPFHALQPGDVVILNGDASHVGIYAGFGQILNAYDWGVPVGFTPLSQFEIYDIRRFY
ncbi:NlpC/P60 family protein [Nocardia huaxiensis]|uniref:NlpC/P60 family protein n=1 Tax=Nocardia huaxiensis TaxID=2755382 RepID=UPI001E2B66C5|nr:NlpC/P60 family protein [Nocardia huaxiensis]UFS99453.1 C40 family peptidase [Nocardia huaxiensis]